MLFGPIFTLELVTGARRARYYIVRVLYALVLLALLWINYMESSLRFGGSTSIQDVANFSAAFFTTFAFAQLTAVMLLAPAMIAGTIAQERERRTIEYLFASCLSNSEIVLSKFSARMLHVASMLLVGLPVLALAMMLGGIPPRMLAIAFVVTLAALVFVGSLSIAASVWARRSRDAVIATYIYLLALLILPAVVAGMSSLLPAGLAWIGTAAMALISTNPYAVLIDVWAPRAFGISNNGWWEVVPLVVTSGVASAAMLTWSVANVRRISRAQASAGPKRPRLALARWRPRPRVGEWPMLWKELFAGTSALRIGRLGTVAVLLLMAAAVLPVVWMLIDASSHGAWFDRTFVGYVMTVATVLECAALLLITVRAASSITSEKERDTWLTLASTTLTAPEIVWSKIAGAIYATRWLLAPVVILWGLALCVRLDFLFAIPVLAGTFAVAALWCASLGVWFSSFSRTSIRAMAGAAAVAVLLSGGGYLMCCVPMFFVGGDETQLLLAPCIPFLLAIPSMGWFEFIVEGRQSLDSDAFRMLVTYAFGMVGYAILGPLLAVVSTGSPDVARRPVRSEFVPPPRGTLPTPPAA